MVWLIHHSIFHSLEDGVMEPVLITIMSDAAERSSSSSLSSSGHFSPFLFFTLIVLIGIVFCVSVRFNWMGRFLEWVSKCMKK